MYKKRIILIGTSSIAEFHVKALRKAGLEVVAVASSNTNSISQKRFAKKNGIKKEFTSWKKMIQEEKYDGIVIATRIQSTIEILLESIKKNVPILVEKPISFESKKIENILEKSHPFIMVGYNRRFYKTVKKIKELVIKEKDQILAVMFAPENLDEKSFLKNSSHSIDILRYIFGEIKLKHKEKIMINKTKKTVTATFTNKKNDLIKLIINWEASDNFSLSIFIRNKKILLKPYEELFIFDEMKIIEPDSTSPIRKYVPKMKKNIKLESADRKIKPGFFQQSKTFAEMIKKKKITKDMATLEDAYKNILLCEKLLK